MKETKTELGYSEIKEQNMRQFLPTCRMKNAARNEKSDKEVRLGEKGRKPYAKVQDEKHTYRWRDTGERNENLPVMELEPAFHEKR